MKCNEVKKNLVDYIEKELDKKQELEIEKHISTCKPCRKEMLEFKRTLKSAKSIKVEKQDERYWVEFDVKLRNRLETNRKLMNIFKPVLAAAALVLVLLIALPFNFDNKTHNRKTVVQNIDENKIIEGLKQNIENYYPLIEEIYLKSGIWEDTLNGLSEEYKDKLIEEFAMDLLAENI